MPKSRKKILIAPLDWGLGHATRCVPIIKKLLQNNTEVIIAGSGNSLSFLQKEFPQVETTCLPGYEIAYPAERENMALKIVQQIPKILYRIHLENKWLHKFIKNNKIDGVISDQRFGLYTNLVPCAFITHQVIVKTHLFEYVLYTINKYFIEKYSECWIPDFNGFENLSGDLSHKYPLPSNSRFIGPLSRFQDYYSDSESGQPELGKNNFFYDAMAIISGPEPQRTIFERIILSQLKKLGLKAILVRGLTKSEEYEKEGSIEIFSHLRSKDMADKIISSKIIIARSGYSTIMDLAALRKQGLLIPTPGQTEQEYLGAYHFEKKNFFCRKQAELDLNSVFSSLSSLNEIIARPQDPGYGHAIIDFLNKC